LHADANVIELDPSLSPFGPVAGPLPPLPPPGTGASTRPVDSRVWELRRLGGLDSRFSNLLEKIPEKLLPASAKLSLVGNTGLILLGLGTAAAVLVGIVVWKGR